MKLIYAFCNFIIIILFISTKCFLTFRIHPTTTSHNQTIAIATLLIYSKKGVLLYQSLGVDLV